MAWHLVLGISANKKKPTDIFSKKLANSCIHTSLSLLPAISTTGMSNSFWYKYSILGKSLSKDRKRVRQDFKVLHTAGISNLHNLSKDKSVYIKSHKPCQVQMNVILPLETPRSQSSTTAKVNLQDLLLTYRQQLVFHKTRGLFNYFKSVIIIVKIWNNNRKKQTFQFIMRCLYCYKCFAYKYIIGRRYSYVCKLTFDVSCLNQYRILSMWEAYSIFLELCHTTNCLVLTIFNEEAYLTFKSIFHKALNLFWFDCEIMLESVPGTNQF